MTYLIKVKVRLDANYLKLTNHFFDYFIKPILTNLPKISVKFGGNYQKMKKYLFLLALAAIMMTACQQNAQKSAQSENDAAVITQQDKDLLAQAQLFFKPLPAAAENPDNMITEAKVKLGKHLYFDNRLSKDGNQSCNSCHNLDTYGVDNLPTSPGDNGISGTRNSPTTFNAALRTAQFWDGRNKDVEEQAGGPVLNPAEMGMPSEEVVVNRLSAVPMYVTMFAEAFPEESITITYANMRNAIGAFERTLITPTKFDSYLSGDVTALNTQESQGLKLFIDQGCIACHTGSLLGGTMLQKFGLYGDYTQYVHPTVADAGKFNETKIEADKDMFYVPGLRNVEKTYPYFHNGGVSNLDEAIQIMGKLQLNKEFEDKQVDDMVAFFTTLTGDIPEEVKVAPAGM